MSSATVRILDAGELNLVVEVETDPPLPYRGGELDVDALNHVQAAALYAAQQIADAGSGDLLGVIRTGPLTA